MSKYPISLASEADLPMRADGTVIYGAHMNAVQNEIIQIERTLGVGSSDVVPSLLSGGFETLADRLQSMTQTSNTLVQHRNASSGVHGVSGSVVGTTDEQTLRNKTLISPSVTGSIDASNTTVGGSVSFAGAVNFRDGVTFDRFTAYDYSDAQHNHTNARNGGRIPPSAIYDPVTGKTLPEMLEGTPTEGHTHRRVDITDFAHALTDHTGSLPATRITGLGTGATMNVPTSPGASATGTQLVRGDDPRLVVVTGGGGSSGGGTVTPGPHAHTHGSSGSDRLTPAAIGAAAASHTHTRSQISNFAHSITDHSGDLPLARVSGLQSALNAKLNVSARANDSTRVMGKRITVATSAPAQAFAGDVWISY